VPYTLLGHGRKYRPDCIDKLDLGEPQPLHLVVEIKGYMGEGVHAKNDAMFSHWLPAVNNHGGFGRWAFLVVKGIYDARQQLDDLVASQRAAQAA
jgi:type III restriction enzyme